MKTFQSYMLVCFFFLSCSSQNKLTQLQSSHSSIIGVWKVEQFASRMPDSIWSVRPAPYESLYIFSTGYYSYSYVIGPNPWKLFAADPNRPTDAEKVSAYDSFVSNSGSYTLVDSTLALTAFLHKNPNEMKKEPLLYTIKIDGNKMTLTIINPPFLPGRQWRTYLVKIE